MIVSGLALAVLCAPASAALLDSPLAGPGVEAGSSETTLIDRNIDGSMRRLDLPPAEAAIERMELSERVRADIDEMLAARAAVIDEASGRICSSSAGWMPCNRWLDSPARAAAETANRHRPETSG